MRLFFYIYASDQYFDVTNDLGIFLISSLHSELVR